MQQEAIFYPALALVFHSFLVWCWMYVDRVRAVRVNKIPISVFRDQRTLASAKGASSTASDNLKNLFELPVLFYVAVLLIHGTNAVSSLYLILAWFFVGLRVLHSLVHITYNNILHRLTIYLSSSLILWAIWINIALALLAG